MTKEEQLRIYSAYLPYGLKVLIDKSDFPKIFYMKFANEDLIEELVGIKNNKFYVGGSKIDVSDDYKFKPILYDLSYLTKEIESEGKLIIPIVEIYKKANRKAKYGVLTSGIEKTDYGKSYNIHVFEDGNHVFKFSSYTHGYGTFFLDNLMITNAYTLYQELFRLHFNFFNLPEGEYINKATLTNK